MNNNWQLLTTDINIAVGLAFGVNIPERQLVSDLDSARFNVLAKSDIAKGEQVSDSNLDKFWTVDDERLVVIGRYGNTSGKYQCYVSKNGVKDGATLYYTNSGKLMVKQSDHIVKAVESSNAYTPVKKDIFATA